MRLLNREISFQRAGALAAFLGLTTSLGLHGSSEPAILLFEHLASQDRVDHLETTTDGRLVAWDMDDGRGFDLGTDPKSPQDQRFEGPRSIRIAVHPTGGRAFLTGVNRTVEIHRPDGTKLFLDPGGEIGDLLWIDAGLLALTPANGDHRIELWDVERRERRRGIDPVDRLPETPGYRPARSTELQWDERRRILHALDTSSGVYRAFDLAKPDPRQIRQTALEDHNESRWEQQLAQLDRQLVGQGEYQGPLIWRFSLSLDLQGNAWTVERCDREPPTSPTSPGGVAHLLAITPDGSEHRLSLETPCCSLDAVAWGDRLAFTRGEAPGRAACFTTVPRPSIPTQTTSTWLEVTSLTPTGPPSRRGGAYGPALVRRLTPGEELSKALASVATDTTPGLALACFGGAGQAVGCSQIWLDPDAEAPDLPAATPGKAVTGTVTRDGAPLAGARVSLAPETLRTTRSVTLPLELPPDADEPVRRVETDREGRFLLPPLAPGSYRLLLELPGGRTDAGRTFDLSPPRSRSNQSSAPPLDLGELEFPGGISLEVRVTDNAGLPLADAQAGAGQEELREAEGSGGFSPMTLFQAVTDESGLARLDGLEADRPLVVSCTAPGHGWWRQRYEIPPERVDCALDPLATVTGRVVDGDGRPLPDARVSLDGGSANYSGALEIAALDEEGHFLLGDLEPGRFRLVAAHPGRETASRYLTLRSGEAEDLGELRLDPGGRWIHRIVDRQGEPLVGATLRAVEPEGSMLPGTSDHRGEIEVEGPLTGALKVEVAAAGHAARRVEVPEAARQPGAEPHEIALQPGGQVLARVWDEATGEPCLGCRVSLSGPGPAESLVTGADGTARSEPLTPGTWRAAPVEVRSTGGMVTRSGGDRSRAVEVRPGATVEVRFGEPREHLEVVLSPAPTEPGWRLLVGDARGDSRAYPLDLSGTASVARPTGPVPLGMIRDSRTISLGELDPEAADPFWVELPTASLVGRLVPIPGDDGTGASPRLWLRLIDLTSGRVAAQGPPDPEGRFRFPYLAAGAYRLEASGRPLSTVTLTPGRETALGELPVPSGPVR